MLSYLNSIVSKAQRPVAFYFMISIRHLTTLTIEVRNGNLLLYFWKFQGQRSLIGYSLWGHKVLDSTAYMHTPLQ